MKEKLSQYFRIFSWFLICCLTIYIISLTSNIMLGNKIKDSIQYLFCEFTSSVSNNIYYSGSSMVEYIDAEKSKISPSSLMIINKPQSPFIQYVGANKREDSDELIIKYGDTNDLLTEYTADDVTVPGTTSSSTSVSDTTTTVDIAPFTPTDETQVLQNDVFFEELDESAADTTDTSHVLSESSAQTLLNNQAIISQLKASLDTDYLVKNFYRPLDGAGIDRSIFKVNELLEKDLSITKDSTKPQILILHTHAHEEYADSQPGVVSDHIVGVGDVLANLLETQYGYKVIHHTTQYSYNSAYNNALTDVKQILAENPSIQVVLDLHRNSPGSAKKAVTIDGKEMAPILFFNGVSYTTSGPRTSLPNKNLQTNLAFSLQMKLLAMEQYPELTKKIDLKSYRFNMHQVGRYALVEVGDTLNTVEEAKNAMTPLADLLNQVLSGQK